jgi:hypothetical protein
VQGNCRHEWKKNNEFPVRIVCEKKQKVLVLFVLVVWGRKWRESKKDGKEKIDGYFPWFIF